MKILQKQFSKTEGWKTILNQGLDGNLCNLVILFSSRDLIEDSSLYSSIKKEFPNAHILLNSTAGEIIDSRVLDGTIVLTAIHFEKTKIQTSYVDLQDEEDSFAAGKKLAKKLTTNNLRNVLLISDGQKVNGSELVEGFNEILPKNIIITGGLAGDGKRFEKTLVGVNGPAVEGRIVALGFYGENIIVKNGTFSQGWDSFGPERLITKSTKNILYSLDGRPALEVYKKYLGAYANELPSSAMLFPLCIIVNGQSTPIIRTILNINEKENSMVFAGNIPQGGYARFMRANAGKMIEDAEVAAKQTLNKVKKSPELALLVSCVGRKFVLNQRIDEEVEVVKSIYGDHTAITGFYSYGEIAPLSGEENAKTELYNQTISITTFTEV